MLKSIGLIITSASLAAVVAVHAERNEQTVVLNDAQIAQIVVTADTVDVNYGKLAVKTTENPEVKAFAETMIRDHSSVNDQATALAKKLGVTPQKSELSKNLDANGKKKLDKLKELSGSEFDKAYIDNEVTYHEAVIGVMDKTLMPNVKNPELKALLEKGRPIFVSHLEHAKKIQKSIDQ